MIDIRIRASTAGALIGGAALTAMVTIAGCSTTTDKPAETTTPSASSTEKAVRTNVTKAPIGQPVNPGGSFHPSVAPLPTGCPNPSCDD